MVTTPPSGGARRRMVWTVADQGLSSITNFALAVLVARSVDVEGFGAFAIAFSGYLFAAGIAKAVASEPLMVRFSGVTDPVALRSAGGEAVGTALVVGVLTEIVAVVAGYLLGGELGAALLALGVVLPGLLLQDAWRFYFFAIGRPARATANDALWAVTQLVLVGVMVSRGTPKVSSLVLAWGASAAVCAVVGCFQAGVVPRMGRAAAWVGSHRDLAPGSWESSPWAAARSRARCGSWGWSGACLRPRRCGPPTWSSARSGRC